MIKLVTKTQMLGILIEAADIDYFLPRDSHLKFVTTELKRAEEAFKKTGRKTFSNITLDDMPLIFSNKYWLWIPHDVQYNALDKELEKEWKEECMKRFSHIILLEKLEILFENN